MVTNFIVFIVYNVEFLTCYMYMMFFFLFFFTSEMQCMKLSLQNNLTSYRTFSFLLSDMKWSPQKIPLHDIFLLFFPPLLSENEEYELVPAKKPDQLHDIFFSLFLQWKRRRWNHPFKINWPVYQVLWYIFSLFFSSGNVD